MELTTVDDDGLAKLWNELAVCFEVIKTDRPKSIVHGFFELSRETERRGLEMDKDRAGKIILKPKKAENGNDVHANGRQARY